MNFYLLLKTWVKILAVNTIKSAKKKQQQTDAIKSASKRAIQKPAEATSDLIGKKIADKITSVSKKYSAELRSAELHSINDSTNNEAETTEKDISPAKRQQIIDDLRLI